MKYLFIPGIVAFIVGFSSLSALAADKAGDVVSVRGNAHIERGSEDIGAKIKDTLLEKDNVLTGNRSRIKMLFRDDSILTLGSNSKLIVSQYLYSPEEKRAESIYELIDGKLRTVVGNAGLTVKTPTAFAAARGTIFLIWYDRDRQATGIAVIEGEVEIRSISPDLKDIILLKAGNISYVYNGEAPQEPTVSDLSPEGEAGQVLGDVSGDGDVTPGLTEPDQGPPQFEFGYPEWNASPLPPVDQTPAAESTPVNIELQFQ